MNVNPKQLAAVVALPGPERFKHFIKVVADWQKAWGLYKDGWALAATDDGTHVFPLWPAMEYAEICAQKDWGGYKPRSIEIDELTKTLLPKLKSDQVLPGIFYTPTGKGTTPSVDELIHALEEELKKY